MAPRADGVRRRRRFRRPPWRRSSLPRCCSSRFPCSSGSSTGRRPQGRRAAGSFCAPRRRLVVRLRLFPARAVLDRRGVSRRGGGVRLAAAVCRAAAAGRTGAVHGLGGRRGAPCLAARHRARSRAGVDARVGRMAARPRAHRLSLERAGLRADVAAADDAVGVGLRHLWPDAAVRRHLRRPAGAHRRRAARHVARARRSARARLGGRSAADALRPRRLAAVRQAARHARQRAHPHRAGERAAAGQVAPGKAARDLRGSAGAVAPRRLGAAGRSRRHHASDLAGGGDAVPAAGAPGGAGRHRRDCCRAARSCCRVRCG